jgi:hypothetical protein
VYYNYLTTDTEQANYSLSDVLKYLTQHSSLLHKHHERNQNEVDKSIGGCGNTTRNAHGTPP